jgi:hypothetical protein
VADASYDCEEVMPLRERRDDEHEDGLICKK